MGEVLELQNAERVCRLCLSENGPRSSVFGSQDSRVSLAAKIQTYLSIQISVSDKLSTRICADCVRNVNHWHNYKEACLKSQVKLNQWLEKQTQSVPLVVTIKDEPIDLDFDDNVVEVISNNSDMRVPNLYPINGAVHDGPLEESIDALRNLPDKDHSTPLVNVVGPSRSPPQLEKQLYTTPLKPETRTDSDAGGFIGFESQSNSELILNPFARKRDIIEADSTELSNTSVNANPKRKVRRRPHTHFRGAVKFRQKCKQCKIYLYSKNTYSNHMKVCQRAIRTELQNHLTENSEKEFAKVTSASLSPPKLTPMTPVQSRTKTVKNTPQAMKTNIGSPYMGGDPQYNNTCDLCGMIYKHKSNMLKHRELCVRLLPHVRTSYTCAHCGKTFLVFKKFHSHLTCDHKIKTFTCVDCNAVFTTPKDFLADFETHRGNKIKQRAAESRHTATTSPGTLSRSIEDWDSFEAEMNSSKTVDPKFTCALCNQGFATRGELVEHKNTHLKVKIYSCVICRSMFSSASALEVHMIEHGVIDTNERNNSYNTEYERPDNSLLESNLANHKASELGNTNCNICGKIFANEANARRHERTVHDDPKRKTLCAICSESFEAPIDCARHLKQNHSENWKVDSRIQCPHCSKTYASLGTLKLHTETDHKVQKKNGYDCNICGKSFTVEVSMKKHRATHSRYGMRNDTSSLGAVDQKPRIPMNAEQVVNTTTERPAKARKSFPNPPPGNFECQVCHDRFADVTDLRKHLWDVHCARNKPEKLLTENELECEICSALFSDKETLKVHVEWHNANPILSDVQKPSFTCNVCGKNYSTQRGLVRHKKIHEASTVASIKFQSIARKPSATQFMCTICRRVFTTLLSLQRHRMNFHGDAPTSPLPPEEVVLRERTNSISEPKAKRMKLEMKDTASPSSDKKAVMCHSCKKMFPNLSILYRHKQQVHKQILPKQQAPVLHSASTSLPKLVPITQADGTVSCNICKKKCAELVHLRRHYTLKHLKPSMDKSLESNEFTSEEVINQAPPPPKKARRRLSAYSNVVLCCTLCDHHVFMREAMTDHIKRRHGTNYDAAVDKNLHRETDISTYKIDGVDFKSQECPHCRIKYPNFRVLKVHYFRFHDGDD